MRSERRMYCGASIMKRRHGFTLVELMVSMALIIFIMAILSQAFIAALGVFRSLKAQGDLAEKLRGTAQILQHDLAADHFDAGRKLSDKNFWLNGPPTQGFFRIWQGNNWTTLPGAPVGDMPPEGVDVPAGIGTYVNTQHYLAFTVKLNGNDMGDFMTAGPLGGGAVMGNLNLPGSIPAFGPSESRYQFTSGAGAYNYQWAEVAWFLQPQINPATGQQDTTVADPQSIDPSTKTAPALPRPLYTLYRRQCLLVPDNNLVTLGSFPGIAATQPSGFLEMSCWPDTRGFWHFNNPSDITVPWRRFGMVLPNPITPLPPNPMPGAPAGLLYATQLPYTPPYAWSFGPPTPPVTPPPWGSWVPPNGALPLSPTYLPSVTATGQTLYPLPSYPTLAQQGSAALAGSDIQLNDVISFDVRIYDPTVPPNGTDPFVTLFTAAESYYNGNPAVYNPTNPSLNPSAPAVFDTWTSINDNDGINLTNYSNWSTFGTLTSIPMWKGAGPLGTGPSIKAIQITIRLWDYKTNQTRQVTIVQAM
jgi:prepilin-type N-terminal cleavage/methylation domain-containing protein